MNPNHSSSQRQTHSILIGYALWVFGFMGAHRFYYGKPISGTLWLCTFGLLGVGWLFDIFLIPNMDRKADQRYKPGPLSYNVCWLLLTYLGVFGVHRFYQGKWVSGVVYFFTLGLLGIGIAYDYWNLNDQIDAIHNAG